MNLDLSRTLRRLALGVLLLGAGAAAAAGFTLPPLVEPASNEHHAGKVVWMDLLTPDLAGAERFYSGLFGWSFQDLPGGDSAYAIATLDGRPVAGLLQKAVPAGERRQPAWLTFFAVSGVDIPEQVALSHGAKLLVAPRSFPDRGRQAIFRDPDGAVFALLASTSGDPPDVLAQPGERIWSSLLTHDADTEAAFYQTLFGYDVFDLASDDGREHLVLSSDDYARAGVNQLPDDSHRHPRWMNFVRVTDAAAAAAKAVALGGRVLVEPRLDRQGGRLAIIADPAGALIGLMEWSDQAAHEEPK